MTSARQHPLLIGLTTRMVREVLYTLYDPFPFIFFSFCHSTSLGVVTTTGGISPQSATSKDLTQVSQMYPKRPPYPPPSPLSHSHRRKPEKKRGRKRRKSGRRKRLKVSTPSLLKGPVSAVMQDVDVDDDDDEDPELEWAGEDPTQVPLPRSRDISREPVPLSRSSLSSLPPSLSPPNPTASSSSSSSSSAPQPQPQLQLQPPQRTTRSLKRSFDESSASTSASDTDERHLVERGRDKQTRRNTAGCDVLMVSPTKGPHPANDPEDADTPELSSPSPSLSSSSAISSPSRCSSAFGSPSSAAAAAAGPELEHPLPIPSKKLKCRVLHPMTMKTGGYERPLTRRQRKALGLPKQLGWALLVRLRGRGVRGRLLLLVGSLGEGTGM